YQAWNDRAHALYQLQQWSDAVKSWSQAIEIMPGNHLFWYNRGCALEQLSQWSEAIASYEKALEIKPDFQPGRSRYINLIADNSPAN
ncbi:MAG: tetratricopeptide repeat protein, partial [Cyanobacteria bacterium J06623_7]